MPPTRPSPMLTIQTTTCSPRRSSGASRSRSPRSTRQRRAIRRVAGAAMRPIRMRADDPRARRATVGAPEVPAGGGDTGSAAAPVDDRSPSRVRLREIGRTGRPPAARVGIGRERAGRRARRKLEAALEAATRERESLEAERDTLATDRDEIADERDELATEVDRLESELSTPVRSATG